ncbi:protein-glutamate O-methyltransferase CheR [Siccirubricoccus sp. KC 17139]|uniref:protein-glutamate O-methyltransferase n=1 Tax=Siccirubricoccus soli TaxID=2899147 RepID=A0ABT1DAV7_9PROT|nr:protein-glutamate O-methyltransferase CheR [Siccirubricoccus soli]MCO6419014.1 protein-glutamate O-methyltransferase CheR [Siccirubricoccus soli]MCP2685149.1 protein-glutamate O-methyltransferase CheR [Siccirubricoccus soli]
MAPPPLGEADLVRFCDFIYHRTGIAYGAAKHYFLQRRVAQGLERSGAASAADYLARLRAEPAEAERFINSVTVNETYFYREEHQLRCLGRSLLGEIVARRGPGDLVRLWSMPCASGEEGYSIAIWLLENWPLVDAYNIEIIGSDLDTCVLAEALAAEYGERALHRLPPEVLERYFEPPQQGRRRLILDLRESVRFTAANLVDAASMAAQGRFDVVFCRNALIYFDDASRAAAAANLYRALLPGGFLCLGHSESMARISDRFLQRRFEDAIVYQRPLAG